MEKAASIYFLGDLNDLLEKTRKNTPVYYAFKGAPSLKDAIEALGVPHPEVGEIAVNGTSRAFTDPLTADAKVEVYPVVPEGKNSALPSLQKPVSRPVTFVVDVHLGKLARYLRLLGFDTLYDTTYNDATIAQLAAQQNRVVLTRDIGLLKQKHIIWGRWLRSQNWEVQLKEVFLRFGLTEADLKPFTRCLACNGLILEKAKQEVVHLLPPKTKQFFHQFYQCTICARVYWGGSHYEKMERFVQKVRQELG